MWHLHVYLFIRKMEQKLFMYTLIGKLHNLLSVKKNDVITVKSKANALVDLSGR